MRHDPRITPARGDLAAAHLEGEVEAERFVSPVRRMVCAPVAPVSATPDGSAEMTTQLLWGEAFDAYEEEGLWAWGQALADGYVGYVPRTCLDAPLEAAPTHRVAALTAPVYPLPDFKARPGGQIPYGARVAVAETVEGNQATYAGLAGGGFLAAAHLAPLEAPAADWAGEAERFLGTPSLWGGRAALGIDCPRDTDMQAGAVGRTLAQGTAPRRGDLVFWKGHVGVMLDADRMLHANIHHMAVAAEPLSEAAARIAAKGGGGVTRHARIDGEAEHG